MLFAEWPDFLTVDRHESDGGVFLDQRYDDEGARSGRSGKVAARHVVLIHRRAEVRDLHRPFRGDRLSRGTTEGAGRFPGRLASPQLDIAWRRIVHSHEPEHIALAQRKHPETGLANARGAFQYLGKHRLQITRRARDDAKHVRGCGLLFQRFAQLVKSRAFSIAITACAAKFCTSKICFSVNGNNSRR